MHRDDGAAIAAVQASVRQRAVFEVQAADSQISAVIEKARRQIGS